MRSLGRFWRAIILSTAHLLILLALGGGAALAGERGSETNLPLPRFVSLKAGEANVRRGPSLTHKIDWVFTRRAMPLEVTAEFGHWRRVRDRDGVGGWVHYALLSGVRSVIVERDLLPLYLKPEMKSAVNAYAELGVVAGLGRCQEQLCRIVAAGYKGWAEKTGLWGVLADEIRE
jgi:SH3-like domain-containing protein